MKKIITALFFLIVSCRPSDPLSARRVNPHRDLAPIWEWTEYIFTNQTGRQIKAVHRESGDEVFLKNGECVLVDTYHSLELKDRKGAVICSFFRENRSSAGDECSERIADIKKAERFVPRRQGPFSYIEFYNIVNGKSVFEKAGAERERDRSFSHSCQTLPKDYSPPSERIHRNDPRIRRGV